MEILTIVMSLLALALSAWTLVSQVRAAASLRDAFAACDRMNAMLDAEEARLRGAKPIGPPNQRVPLRWWR